MTEHDKAFLGFACVVIACHGTLLDVEQVEKIVIKSPAVFRGAGDDVVGVGTFRVPFSLFIQNRVPVDIGAGGMQILLGQR